MGEHWEPAPSKGQVKRGDMLVTSKEGRAYMFPAQELHVPKPREATDLKMPFAMVMYIAQDRLSYISVTYRNPSPML